MTVRSARSRRRRRWTAAINAMNGALVIGAVVAVIEIGSPVANNLGLSVASTSTAGQVARSQVLQNAAVPNWEQEAASVAHATTPGSVVAQPSTAEALVSNVSSVTVPSVPPAAPVAQPTVTASPTVAATPVPTVIVALAPTSTVPTTTVSSPVRTGGPAGTVTRPPGHGPPVGPGSQPGGGQPGRNAGGPPGSLAGAATGGDGTGLPGGGPPDHGPWPGQGGPGAASDHDSSHGPPGSAGADGRPPWGH
jgi:hypothetical protein